MRKVFNFSAGPGMLPEDVMLKAQAEFLDWNGTGMSIMELGHRGPEFQAVVAKAERDLRDLMDIPANYQIFFLPGGATAQFAMVPINLLCKTNKADYVVTGVWSEKAIAEAARYGDIHRAASIEINNGLKTIPDIKNWSLREEVDYVHYTPNETVDGVEFHYVPDTKGVTLVADMSSMILSREIDVTKFGVIYAGAQKNIGQAGITVVIARDDLIHEPKLLMPTLYSYKIHAETHSFYNTPPTYAWYFAGLVFDWLKQKGGVKYFEILNQRKADKLYSVIDEHADFYLSQVNKNCRSRMNVTFNLPNDHLTQKFLRDAKSVGLVNLAGHKVAGGIRASIYNAMPEEGVDALVDFMQGFVKKS